MSSIYGQNDLYEKIALNIKKYRKEAGITQAVLAERVGVSHEFIRRIESTKGILVSITERTSW